MGRHSGRFICCFFSATGGWANVVAIASAVLRGVARSESIALCILQQTYETARGVRFETISASLVVALKLSLHPLPQLSWNNGRVFSGVVLSPMRNLSEIRFFRI